MIILEAPGIALVTITKMLNGKSNSPGNPQGLEGISVSDSSKFASH